MNRTGVFNNIKIGTKLMVGFLLISLMCVCVGVVLDIYLSNLGGNLNKISNVELPAVDSLKSIDKELNYLVACERGLNMDLIFNEKSLRRDLFKSVTESWVRLENSWAKYERLPKGEDEKSLWNEFIVKFGVWKTKHAEVI